MKRIGIVIAMFTLPLILTLKVSGQVVSTGSVKTEALKDPRFSVSVGLGNASMSSYFNFDNSKAASVKIGYSLSKYFEVQGEYSNFSGFDWAKEKGDYSFKQIDKICLDFKAISLNLKAGIPFTIGKVSLKPYFVMGIGRNKFGAKSSYQELTSGVMTYDYTASYSSFGKTSKIGGGLDVSLNKNLFFFYEFNRWKLYSDLDDGYIFECSQSLFGIGGRF